jgi:hypothetical protein
VASEGCDPGFWGKLLLRRRGGKSDNDVTSVSSVSVPVLKKRSYRRIAGLRGKNARGGAKIETGAGEKEELQFESESEASIRDCSDGSATIAEPVPSVVKYRFYTIDQTTVDLGAELMQKVEEQF